MALTASETLMLEELFASFEDVILFRGEELFEKDHVRFLSVNGRHKVFSFTVHGSSGKSYHVAICLAKKQLGFGFDQNPSMETRCNCAYFDGNDSCKHIAAAACFLEANSDENLFALAKMNLNPAVPTKAISVKNQQIFPIEVVCREDELESLVTKLPQNSILLNQHRVQNIELLENGVQYELNLLGWPIELQLRFDPKEGRVKVTCSEKNSYNHGQSLAWLHQRWSNPDSVELKLVTAAQRLREKILKLEILGLMDVVSDPDKAFKLGFMNGEIRFFYSGELEGMKDMVALGNDFKDFSSKNIVGLGAGTVFENADSKEYGLYNAAFALAINDQGGLYNIFPFVAKGKKNDPAGFHVRFDLLEDPDDLRLAKNDEMNRLLLEVKQMRSYLERRKAESLHKAFLTFVAQVKDQYPVFRSYGSYYYDKFHKNDIKERLEFRYAELEFSLVRSKTIFELQAWLVMGEERVNIALIYKELSVSSIFGLWKDRIILLFENFGTVALLGYWKDRVPARFVESKFPEFATHVIKPLSAFAKITDETGRITEVDLGVPSDRELYITELSGLVIFEPKVKYTAEISANPLSADTLFEAESNSIFLRNSEVENKFVEFLQALHPSFDRGFNNRYFHLKQNQFTEGRWFLEAFEKLKAAGISVFGLNKLTLKRYSPFKPAISLSVSSNSDWFEITTQLKFGDYSIRLKDIKQAIQAGEQYVRLGDGSLGQIPDKWLRKFRRLIQSSETDGDTVKLSKIHFSLLSDFEEDIVSPAVEKELAEKKDRLQSFEEIRTVEVPKLVRAELRNYQKVGLNWMSFLQEFGWGGILADDMGLGKTLQVITLISQMAARGKVRVLIVAPTTLLFNWKNELEKFAPELDYFIHHGDRYDTVEELLAHSIVLTSYGLVINDLELLTQLEFDLIVADESQAIKNVSSLRYKSITKLRGKLKIAMTGTPIENGIAELFAHMNFVNPGFFRNFSSFKDNYLKELRNGNPEVLEDLRMKIQPFVLRRTKEEVLTELPDKIEEYLYCEMGAAQKKVYEAYRNEYREFLQGKFDEEGANQSKMYVLEGLTKLRQICDSPDLISKEEKGAKSAKIDLLMEHIVEKTGNHKVLIFSQFVKMLDLVKAELASRNIPFSYLDGKSSMKDRENSVNEFQEDSSIRVFLISLKAGGIGLNLTAADYVYILDPWWNPAVENQAIDRCYRMGQEKKVMAYRMICKDTVEEKIMELQKSKLKLAKEVISEGDGFLVGMNGDTMLKLFE
ncbi:hypothetical protein GCM10009119_12090 [Algoriphagus jejuensis]|uniref:Non-specific serine/threonine protein kinase n=1 Tax=Algoriphagus jejuensis TaxID=419934 RepID=A0ABN1MYP5_9BACT